MYFRLMTPPPSLCLFPCVSGTMWAHNKHVLKMSSILSCLPCYFPFSFIYFFASSEFHCNNAFYFSCNSAVLSCLFLPWVVGVFLCAFIMYLCLCVLIYVVIFQFLQKIWKRASGRWRGSCYSWRETWRLFPPQVTPVTCSSLKWLYPFTHVWVHLFTCLWNCL